MKCAGIHAACTCMCFVVECAVIVQHTCTPMHLAMRAPVMCPPAPVGTDKFTPPCQRVNRRAVLGEKMEGDGRNRADRSRIQGHAEIQRCTHRRHTQGAQAGGTHRGTRKGRTQEAHARGAHRRLTQGAHTGGTRKGHTQGDT